MRSCLCPLGIVVRSPESVNSSVIRVPAGQSCKVLAPHDRPRPWGWVHRAVRSAGGSRRYDRVASHGILPQQAPDEK
jgi:hypothetical protein